MNNHTQPSSSGRAPSTTPDPAEAPRTHLHRLLLGFETVMLATFDRIAPEPHVHARPMTVAALHDDCSMSFFTHIGSSKVHEALCERTGHVIAQSKSCSINMAGGFTVTQADDEMRPLFTKRHEVWFPDGLDDAGLALLTFHPHEAEIWDTSGLKGLKLVTETAKALFTGDDIDVRWSHEKLRF